MKKIISLILAVMMTVALVACGNASATKMTMGTGGTAGTYYGYGGVLSQYMKNKAGIDVTVVSTDGSKANIQGIAAGDYQLGTVQSDVMAYAWDGSRSFEKDGKVDSIRVIAGLYAEAVQLVTMDPEIKSVADLKGKSVSIGAPASGVYFNAIDVLNAAGLTEADIKPQYQSFADSLMASCPFYTTYVIPANTYKGQTEDAITAENAKGAELSLDNATSGMTYLSMPVLQNTLQKKA